MSTSSRRDFLRWGIALAGVRLRDAYAGDAERADQAAPDKPASASRVTLLSAKAQVAPFCVGFALRKGDFPSSSALSVGGADAQVTVKNHWSDGSAKFAVVAGSAKLAAGVAAPVSLVVGAVRSGPELMPADLQAVMLAPVSIDCGAFGSASWSGDDWAEPFETWISGPRMSSWIYRKAVGSDAHLVAWLEVRLWNNGAVEVLPWIENGLVLVAGATSKRATYTFALGGKVRFSAPINLLHHCRSVLLSGTALSHWLGTDPDIIVKHDRRYLQSTGLVPTYLARTPANASVVAALPRTFTPLQQGSWPNGIGGGGYSNSIGLLPEWDALYLTCDAPATYRGVVFNAYSAGRYGIHYRDEKTNRPVRLMHHPALNIREPDPGWRTTPATSGNTPPSFGSSHQPSAAFLAYLVTGRRYFLDELQFVVGFNALAESTTQRENGKGLYKSTAAGAIRHVAWLLRSLAQTIAVTPDSDAEHLADCRTQYKNNIDYYHARYIAQPHNPFGFVTPYSDYSNVAGLVAAGASASVIRCNPGALGGAPYNITVTGQYTGQKMRITDETRSVVAYDAATETVTVSPPFSKAPAPGTAFQISDEKCFDAPWMSDFLIAVLGYAKDLELGLDSKTTAKFDAFYTWKAKSVIGRLGTSAATDFLYRDYAPYALAVAPFDSPGGIPANDKRWNSGTGPWFNNWGEIYAATFSGATPPGRSYPPYASPGPRVDGSLRSIMSPEYPAAIALAAIAYAVKHTLPGAAAGYRRLTQASNWREFVSALNLQPVWAVVAGETPQAHQAR